MKDRSPVFIAADEDRRHQVSTQLIALNTPSVASQSLPFDYMWTVDGEVVAGERKSIDDFVTARTGLGCRPPVARQLWRVSQVRPSSSV
jgi:hypothetical protein